MTWQPERGWPLLLLRTAAALAAALFLYVSTVNATGLHLAGRDGTDQEVRAHQHEPGKRDKVVGVMERAAIERSGARLGSPTGAGATR